MKKTYNSILDLIGNTPIVEIRNLNPNRNVKIYAKLEGSNPGGSIKDRTALYMIEKALERGEFTKEKIILEATSGNTGIGLALVAAAMGYKVTLVLSESASEERKKILKALGAELVLTPAHLGTDGAIEVVYEMLREHPDTYFVPDQHNNEDNTLAHYHGTAEEIWRQTDNKVTMVVASLGTSGTAMGISRRLKEYNEDIRIVGVEPYLHHKIQGLKNMKESYRPGIFDRKCLDEKINILDEDAFEMARALAQTEGLFVGMSSGAAMHVALEKAGEMKEGLIVVIFPDSGERYLSTTLFADREETSLCLYNTLSRSKEPFKPIDTAQILIHSCGPTVHDVPHIGTYRRAVVSDMISRYLEFKGYKVKHVSNIIDLADRSISGADRADMDIRKFTRRHTETFFSDLDKLDITHSSNTYPAASENVDSMVKLTESLVGKGYAYEKLRSVYFDISRLDNYGLLSNIDLANVRHSRTVDQDNYEKDSPVDFTLLKRSTLAELKKGIYFKTRWGNVRPGWHLECAAMTMEYLAETFDIYISGSDIIFPHCENVMAIGMAATGKMPANYWLASELVMMEGKKMSRSTDNSFTVSDLEEKGYSGREIRYFLLSSHYRKPLTFSFGALDTACNTIKRLNNFIQRLIRFIPGDGHPDVDQLIYDIRKGFAEAMDDDFNISEALACVFEFVRKINISLTGKQLNTKQRDTILDTMKGINSVLRVMNFEGETLSEDATRLMEDRKKARAAGDWGKSDHLRKELSAMGIIVCDTPEGMIWTLK
ncbi:MAG: cysteine--tRNA ligase [Deltaproteobacteria bacterium]|nr:cysteine--tRNA ligase [Deltaproteobacteria bacterium]